MMARKARLHIILLLLFILYSSGLHSNGYNPTFVESKPKSVSITLVPVKIVNAETNKQTFEIPEE